MECKTPQGKSYAGVLEEELRNRTTALYDSIRSVQETYDVIVDPAEKLQHGYQLIALYNCLHDIFQERLDRTKNRRARKLKYARKVARGTKKDTAF